MTETESDTSRKPRQTVQDAKIPLVVAVDMDPGRATRTEPDRVGPYVTMVYRISFVVLTIDLVAFAVAAGKFPASRVAAPYYLAVATFSITFVAMLVAAWMVRRGLVSCRPIAVPDGPDGAAAVERSRMMLTNMFTHLVCLYSGAVMSMCVSASIS
jgi:hypothetical protein